MNTMNLPSLDHCCLPRSWDQVAWCPAFKMVDTLLNWRIVLSTLTEHPPRPSCPSIWMQHNRGQFRVQSTTVRLLVAFLGRSTTHEQVSSSRACSSPCKHERIYLVCCSAAATSLLPHIPVLVFLHHGQSSAVGRGARSRFHICIIDILHPVYRLLSCTEPIYLYNSSFIACVTLAAPALPLWVTSPTTSLTWFRKSAKPARTASAWSSRPVLPTPVLAALAAPFVTDWYTDEPASVACLISAMI